MTRFVDTEKWRAETKLDDLVATWEFPEKAAMFKYYPQYYHKTDKVRTGAFSQPTYGLLSPEHNLTRARRTAAPFTSSGSATSTWALSTRSPPRSA